MILLILDLMPVSVAIMTKNCVNYAFYIILDIRFDNLENDHWDNMINFSYFFIFLINSYPKNSDFLREESCVFITIQP